MARGGWLYCILFCVAVWCRYIPIFFIYKTYIHSFDRLYVHCTNILSISHACPRRLLNTRMHAGAPTAVDDPPAAWAAQAAWLGPTGGRRRCAWRRPRGAAPARGPPQQADPGPAGGRARESRDGTGVGEAGAQEGGVGLVVAYVCGCLFVWCWCVQVQGRAHSRERQPGEEPKDALVEEASGAGSGGPAQAGRPHLQLLQARRHLSQPALGQGACHLSAHHRRHVSLQCVAAGGRWGEGRVPAGGRWWAWRPGEMSGQVGRARARASRRAGRRAGRRTCM